MTDSGLQDYLDAPPVDAYADDFALAPPPLELADLKLPPHSLEAEQSVLGGLMLPGTTAWDAIAGQLQAEDFYRQDHQLIFKAMQKLADDNHPIDVVTLSEALAKREQIEAAGGVAYLFELANNTPSTANIRAYATIVHDRATARRLISAAQDITDICYNPQGRHSGQIIEEAERRLGEIAESGPKRGGPREVNPLLKAAVDRIDELFNSDQALTGITTGYNDLDGMTNGLQKSDLVIVAARPSMGKTTFAMNLVEAAVLRAQKTTVVFSMEMPAEQLILRMLSSIGRIDQTRVRTGKLEEEDWPKLSSAVSQLKDKPLLIDDTPALTPTEMRARVRRIQREKGDVGLVMVDYLQLMQVGGGKSEGRTAEISEISRSLKAIAKEFNCPVIALSQLNRSLEQRPNKRPVMSDLRESGAIEQDADIIAFIYRDEVYNEESPDKGTAEIIIGKQRNGPIGTCRLAFNGRFTRFDNLARESYGSYSNNYE
jgi:replicative DNA helicase